MHNSFRHNNQLTFVEFYNDMSLFSILSNTQQYITTETGSLEVNKMARDSAMKAVMTYHDTHNSNQITLFNDRSPQKENRASALT